MNHCCLQTSCDDSPQEYANKDLSKMISSLEPLESVVKEYASFAELKEKRRYREELQREGE
jgi:hypothetical protein